MKQNKFLALVTLDPAWAGAQHADPFRQSRRLVVRACHRQKRCGKVFSAVVAPADDVPRRPGDPHAVVTMLIVDDDAVDYLGTGDHFDLWLGSTVGRGVISRRVVPCW